MCIRDSSDVVTMEGRRQLFIFQPLIQPNYLICCNSTSVLVLYDNVLVTPHTFITRMSKVKYTESARLQQYVKEFKGIFSSNGKILYCCVCGKCIIVDQQSQVTQHLYGNKHITAASCSSLKQVLFM